MASLAALTLLFCGLTTQVTGQAPEIEADGTNIGARPA